MTSRERILRTYRFQHTDRLPTAFWWDGEWSKYHSQVEIEALQQEMPADEAHFALPTKGYKTLGSNLAKDSWGCVWQTEIYGICGQVVCNPIDDYAKLPALTPPLTELDVSLEKLKADIAATVDKARLIGWMQLYERMRYIRPAQELYVDIALDDPDLYALRDKVMEYLHRELDIYLNLDVDIVVFSEDWGTQTALQISPTAWRKVFKPAYRALFDRIHTARKMVHFHSCGYIREILGDLVDLGCEAVHCMVGIMDMDELFRTFRGKLCFIADFNRQKMPIEGPQWVKSEIHRIFSSLGRGQDGGLEIVAEVAGATPLANVRAYIDAIRDINSTYYGIQD